MQKAYKIQVILLIVNREMGMLRRGSNMSAHVFIEFIKQVEEKR